MNFQRRIRYYYLRFIRLRGNPSELALGAAFGIFTGMMPIMPFQTVTAVALSILFKGSKITAAVGTWVSNPLTWYFLYYYSYKLGTSILGAKEQNAVFSSIMTVIRCGEEPMAIVREFVGAGGAFVAAFLLGGLVIGIVLAVPSYFVFFHLFKYIKSLKASRKGIRKWRTPAC